MVRKLIGRRQSYQTGDNAQQVAGHSGASLEHDEPFFIIVEA